MVTKQILIGMILHASQLPRVEIFFLKSANSNSIKDFPGMESKWMYLDLCKPRRFPKMMVFGLDAFPFQLDEFYGTQSSIFQGVAIAIWSDL